MKIIERRIFKRLKEAMLQLIQFPVLLPSKKMHNKLFISFFLLITTALTAQQRPMIYLGQLSFGSGFSSTLGRGNISTGFINGDSIADIATTGTSTYQIGLGKIEHGQLRFEMQPVQFYGPRQFFFNGQLVDFDHDGDNDFLMNMHTLPYQYWNYLFDNENGQLDSTFHLPNSPIPSDTIVSFHHFNADAFVDAFLFSGGLPTVIDGATGQRFALEKPSNGSSSYRVDLNGDGLMDYLYSRTVSPTYGTFTQMAYINQGDYTFLPYETTGSISNDGYADFDGDGVLDIIDYTGPVSYKIKSNLLSQNEAAIQSFSFPNTLTYPESHLYSDIDEDGLADIVVFSNDSVLFCRNNGDTTFTTYREPLLNPSNLVFAEHPSWSGGYRVAHAGSGAPLVYRFSFDTMGFHAEKYPAAIEPPVLVEPPSYLDLAVGDTDMDGVGELLIGEGNTLFSYEWDSLAFSDLKSHDLPLSRLGSFSALVSADFDADGFLDLAYIEPNAPAHLRLVYGQTDSTFSAPDTLGSGMNLCFYLRTADFNGDGLPDLIGSGGGRTSIFMNQGNRQFEETVLRPERYEFVNLFDPNKDGIVDLLLSDFSQTYILMNDGQGNFSQTKTLMGGIGKIDGIGGPFLHVQPGQVLQFLEITDDGTDLIIHSSADLPYGVSLREGYAFDYNGDGLPDFVGNKSHPNEVEALVVLGDTSAASVSPILLPDWHIMGAQDIDGNDRPEVLWAIGSQLWLEPTDSLIWTTFIKEIAPIPLRLYPNPTVDWLNINLENPTLFDFQLFDSYGRLVHSGNGHQGAVSVAQLSVGAYFLLVKAADGQVYFGRFVKG